MICNMARDTKRPGTIGASRQPSTHWGWELERLPGSASMWEDGDGVSSSAATQSF